MLSISYTIISFVFSMILMIVYFSKDRINYVENKIYSFIVVATFISCLIEIISFCLVQIGVASDSFIYITTMKVLFLGFLTWLYLFSLYTVTTGQKLRGVLKKNKFPIKNLSLAFTIMVLIIMFLPIEISETNGLLLPVGTSVNLIYILASLCIIVMIISMILSRAYLKNKKYIPIYLLIILFAVVLIVQKIFPEFFLVNTAFVIIAFVMYFTIENPDMKMVEELIENRKIIERSSEEKSVFLFKVSQGLREPVNNIDKQIEKYKQGIKKKEEIDLVIDDISRNNQKINYLINDVLGVTSFDSRNIKKVENTYNIYSILEDIKRRAKSYVKDNIEYNFTVVNNMPRELYGDAIKLKQVLMSILINSLKNTEKGFVNIDVNAITKFDVCRIVIVIEDSGNGFDMKTINDILSQDAKIDDAEYLKMEKLDVDLKLAYKIIKLLGGTMYIKSDVGTGTKVIITLDQYIVMNEDLEHESRVDSYIQARSGGKKILIVSENEEEIRKIKAVLAKRGYDIYTSMFGQDCINRIKNKEKYDIILIDDDMTLMSGFSVLEELNKLKNNSKKVVMLGSKKMFIAKHYIKDGFDATVDKEKMQTELIKTLNKM